ncbi:MAG TPA: glycosyltransferase family A protein [Casimicrobiaceae bacterium]|jgi:glycosyltransferase involved in cell wall biosynthesis|nr:glycosyltransferase family A protein [Casimicrobiaceae bacterium]
MISCFTVTQEGRLAVLARALADFCGQTARDRELVIVHDGGHTLHQDVVRLARECDCAPVNVVQAASGQTLGALRNTALAVARGDYVCQWDDDDRYHPRRLDIQLSALRAAKSDCSFLGDQLHLFTELREMYWDDWYEEPYPFNFAPGTLFARRDALARYPELRQGEDTGLVVEMLRQGRSFARLREHGYLHVYVFHGQNSFDQAHHAAISLVRGFRGARLLRLEAVLRARTAEFEPPLGAFSMPFAGGELVFSGGD